MPLRVISFVSSPARPAGRDPDVGFCGSAPRRSRLTNGSRRPGGVIGVSLRLELWPAGAVGPSAPAPAQPGGVCTGAAALAPAVDSAFDAGEGVDCAYVTYGLATMSASATASDGRRRVLQHHYAFGFAGVAGAFGLPAGVAALPGSTRTNVVAVQSALIDRGPRRSFVSGLDVDARHVDDARKFADPLEERPEVVIRAIELQADRPLRIHLPRRDRLRAKTRGWSGSTASPSPEAGATDPRHPSHRAVPGAVVRAAPGDRKPARRNSGRRRAVASPRSMSDRTIDSWTSRCAIFASAGFT